MSDKTKLSGWCGIGQAWLAINDRMRRAAQGMAKENDILEGERR